MTPAYTYVTIINGGGPKLHVNPAWSRKASPALHVVSVSLPPSVALPKVNELSAQLLNRLLRGYSQLGFLELRAVATNAVCWAFSHFFSGMFSVQRKAPPQAIVALVVSPNLRTLCLTHVPILRCLEARLLCTRPPRSGHLVLRWRPITRSRFSVGIMRAILFPHVDRTKIPRTNLRATILCI